MADSPVEGWLEKSTPELMLRCKENKTEAYIITGMAPNVEYGHDAATVLIRFDKEKAQEYRFSKSTDGKALFAPNPIDFIRKMLSHKTMLFQFTPFNASPVMTTFNLNGLSSVFRELQSTCHWQ